MPDIKTHSAAGNLTLSALSEETLGLILPHLTPVELPQGMILVSAGERIRWIYFLTQGMASVKGLEAGGASVEVGIFGREGLVGYQSLLGSSVTNNYVDMQAGGRGFRIPAELLQQMIFSRADLLQGLHRFVYALLEQTTRLILCNRLHDLEARLARWLLMTSDFIGSLHMQLTQEFLAEMLGTARPGVTLAAGELQRKGAIQYSRGKVEILNRALLEQVACDCYGAICEIYRSLYPRIF